MLCQKNPQAQLGGKNRPLQVSTLDTATLLRQGKGGLRARGESLDSSLPEETDLAFMSCRAVNVKLKGITFFLYEGHKKEYFIF